MKFTLSDFFMLTNPLFWIWMLLDLLYNLFKWVYVNFGINDWVLILFTNRPVVNSKQEAELLINIAESKTHKYWLKRKAWEYKSKSVKRKFKL